MSKKQENVDVQLNLDLTCKQIALGNFRLCPMFSKIEPKDLIPTSTTNGNGVKVLCIETPIIDDVYGKAIFQLSEVGIMNYTIAYLKQSSKN